MKAGQHRTTNNRSQNVLSPVVVSLSLSRFCDDTNQVRITRSKQCMYR